MLYPSEPTLMGLPFFRRAVELVDTHLHPGQSAVYTIQPNGTKLDNEYGIDVAPGEDAALILAGAVCVDRMSHD